MDTRARAASSGTSSALVDPQGVHITRSRGRRRRSCEHDFLWRIAPRGARARASSASSTAPTTRTCSSAGCTSWSAPDVIERRYGAIDASSAGSPTTASTIVKCFLHISPRSRGAAARPARRPGQAVEVQPRRRRRAARCGRTTSAPTRSRSSAATPTPRPGTSSRSDRKWYRNWAVAQLLLRDAEATWTRAARAGLRRRRAAGPADRGARAQLSARPRCSRASSASVNSHPRSGPGAAGTARSRPRPPRPRRSARRTGAEVQRQGQEQHEALQETRQRRGGEQRPDDHGDVQRNRPAATTRNTQISGTVRASSTE